MPRLEKIPEYPAPLLSVNFVDSLDIARHLPAPLIWGASMLLECINKLKTEHVEGNWGAYNNHFVAYFREIIRKCNLYPDIDTDSCTGHAYRVGDRILGLSRTLGQLLKGQQQRNVYMELQIVEFAELVQMWNVYLTSTANAAHPRRSRDKALVKSEADLAMRFGALMEYSRKTYEASECAGSSPTAIVLPGAPVVAGADLPRNPRFASYGFPRSQSPSNSTSSFGSYQGPTMVDIDGLVGPEEDEGTHPLPGHSRGVLHRIGRLLGSPKA